MIDQAKAIEILERQSKTIVGLTSKRRGGPEFVEWRRDTKVALQRVFGDSSEYVREFMDVDYSARGYRGINDKETEQILQEAYVGGLERSYVILRSMMREIEEYGLKDGLPLAPDALELIEHILLRFNKAARRLRSRRQNRPTLEIEDEYDVQDLLHALLHFHFDDIRPEEWTPSYAGGASRADFLLKNEKIVIEVKKTRKSLTEADLGAQLLVDIERYQKHPDCECLVCFIYDPEGRIGNPIGLENDLESNKNIKVRAIVSPK